MGIFDILDFDLWRDYIEPSLDEMAAIRMKPAYEAYKREIETFHKVLVKIPQNNVINHVLSILTGVFIENYLENEFSWMRAIMYYFAMYSFTTAFIINELLGFASNQLERVAETKEFLKTNFDEDDEPEEDDLDGYENLDEDF